MFDRIKSDVLIVGAGPAGMLTALILAKEGISVEIIDKESRPTTRSNAFILHPATLRTLDRYGIADRMLEQSYPVETVHLYDDAQIRDSVHLDQLDVAFPRAVSIPESRLEEILEDELEKLHVKIRWDHRASELIQTPHGCEVSAGRLSERTTGYAVAHTDRVIDKVFKFRAKLVVGADGYRSFMRKLMRVENVAAGKDQYFAFFEFDSDVDPVHSARISLDKGLLTAQHPLPNGRGRLSFQFAGLTLPEENREKSRRPVQSRFGSPELLEDKTLTELISDRVPWNTGYINKITWRVVAPFELRVAEKIRVGHIFLLGDAARTFGPLGFTSLNLGLVEAERLALTAKAYLDDSHLLMRLDHLADEFRMEWNNLYDLERRSIPIEMSDPWIANHRNTLLSNLPATGESLERLASQIFIHLSLPTTVDA